MNITMVKGLFLVAAIYDGVLGLVFLVQPGLAFELFDVVPPNHFAYVQFPAIRVPRSTLPSDCHDSI